MKKKLLVFTFRLLVIYFTISYYKRIENGLKGFKQQSNEYVNCGPISPFDRMFVEYPHFFSLDGRRLYVLPYLPFAEDHVIVFHHSSRGHGGKKLEQVPVWQVSKMKATCCGSVTPSPKDEWFNTQNLQGKREAWRWVQTTYTRRWESKSRSLKCKPCIFVLNLINVIVQQDYLIWDSYTEIINYTSCIKNWPFYSLKRISGVAKPLISLWIVYNDIYHVNLKTKRWIFKNKTQSAFLGVLIYSFLTPESLINVLAVSSSPVYTGSAAWSEKVLKQLADGRVFPQALSGFILKHQSNK